MKKTAILTAAALCLALTLCACEKKPETNEASGASHAASESPGASVSQTGEAPSESGEETSQTEPEWKAAAITAAWADGLPEMKDYYEFLVDGGEGAVRAAIFTDQPVRDLRILRLSDPRTNDKDELCFTAETRFSPGTFTPEHPVVIRTVLGESLPTDAISYTDENGQTRVLALTVSGENGALLLTEVTVDP